MENKELFKYCFEEHPETALGYIIFAPILFIINLIKNLKGGEMP